MKGSFIICAYKNKSILGTEHLLEAMHTFFFSIFFKLMNKKEHIRVIISTSQFKIRHWSSISSSMFHLISFLFTSTRVLKMNN